MSDKQQAGSLLRMAKNDLTALPLNREHIIKIMCLLYESVNKMMI
jgi:hypothetical protein